MGSGTRIRRIDPSELVKTILVIVQTREETARIEAALVGLEQVADPLCLNLCEGGGSSLGHTMPESARRAISERSKGNNYRRGKKASPETKAKISASLIGTARATGKRTEEQRARMSKVHQGKKHSTETRAKISKACKAAWDRRKAAE